MLVPSNYASSLYNASVMQWLWYDEDPHYYRIQMTAGKTYIFDEHYRTWAMTSGGWRDGEHFYLPDEYRLSLYTKDSAGELVPVSGFQDQPEDGWQAIYGDDDDYQAWPRQYKHDTLEEFFVFLRNSYILFNNAHFFPAGSQHRNACVAALGDAGCGPGLDIYRDDGRQLRVASYAPTESGIYYLKVTRIMDDQPEYRDGQGWSLDMADNGVDSFDMTVYADGGSGIGYRRTRSAFPYYEISVEVRGPTLSRITIDGDHYMDTIDQTENNDFGFLPGRFNYRVGLQPDTTTVTVSATTVHSDATVVISPADADTSAAGHQVNTGAGAVTDVTFTVSRGDDSEVYTIELSRP